MDSQETRKRGCLWGGKLGSWGGREISLCPPVPLEFCTLGVRDLPSPP